MTRVLLAGATGLVGTAVLRFLLADERVSQVVAPTRRALPAHDRLLNPITTIAELPPDAEWWAMARSAPLARPAPRRRRMSTIARSTSTSSGIGLATARAARGRSADVTIMGRNLERLQGAAVEIGGAGLATIDMADRGRIDRAFIDFGRVDHLVITAGGAHAGRLADVFPAHVLRGSRGARRGNGVRGEGRHGKDPADRLDRHDGRPVLGSAVRQRHVDDGAGVPRDRALARSLALEMKPRARECDRARLRRYATV